MACCGADTVGDPSALGGAHQNLPYEYLFKYIIVGDTGAFSFRRLPCSLHSFTCVSPILLSLSHTLSSPLSLA
jgi:hypothetical protein